jgi:hypothetical protein
MRDESAGPSLATGEETSAERAADRGELEECSRAFERKRAGAGSGARVLRTGCCGLGAVSLAKKPTTDCRALERERDMLSKTREGSRGGLLGTTGLTEVERRVAPVIIECRNR